jgi:NAD(P)-dependent dehydrogenase (short-subunit alcohol dehydrogenase family)
VIRQSTPTRYDGEVAVVTGASSGIGRRLAIDLSESGAIVVGLARRADLLAELDVELKKRSPRSSTRVCDVADADAFEETLRDVEHGLGRIDILINNAGIEQLTPAADGPTEAYRRIFDVNFFGVVTGTLTVLGAMLARRSGIIVNVSSDSGRAPEPGHSAYAASKAAVSAFTESVAHEVAALGVHVHVLYPAWVPTAMGTSGNEDGGNLPPKAVRRTEEQISELVRSRMGGKRMEINAAALPLLAPLGRTIAPVSYQKAMRQRAH